MGRATRVRSAPIATPERLFSERRPTSDLLHLPIFELDRGGPAEDGDGDLEAGARIVDFLDGAVERGERAIRDADLLADLEADGWLRPLHAVRHLPLDPLSLAVGDRHGLRLVRAQEAGDLRRVLDEVMDLVSQVALHQDVAREEFALRVDLAAAAHLDDLLSRHEDLLEILRQAAL